MSTGSQAAEEPGGESQVKWRDLSSFRNIKIVLALRIGTCTGKAFHKAGPHIENALDPDLVFLRETTNLFEFMERRYFEHRTNK